MGSYSTRRPGAPTWKVTLSSSCTSLHPRFLLVSDLFPSQWRSHDVELLLLVHDLLLSNQYLKSVCQLFPNVGRCLEDRGDEVIRHKIGFWIWVFGCRRIGAKRAAPLEEMVVKGRVVGGFVCNETRKNERGELLLP